MFVLLVLVRGCSLMLVGELTADATAGLFFLGVDGHVGLIVCCWFDEESSVLELSLGLVERCC